MLRQCNTRLRFSLRLLSTSHLACANHYDVLGVTPKSTQHDIKSAYYKLSKIYHPDKSTDEDSAKKFRDISAAYEVLGNVKLKKMYDRGLLGNRESWSTMSRPEEAEPTDPSLRFYKSRNSRHAVPTMDGRKPIYDFDAWAKNHYTTLYEKSQYDKEFVKQRRKKQAEAIVAHRQETFMFLMFILGGIFVVLAIQGTADYDQDLMSKKSRSNGQTDSEKK